MFDKITGLEPVILPAKTGLKPVILLAKTGLKPVILPAKTGFIRLNDWILVIMLNNKRERKRAREEESRYKSLLCVQIINAKAQMFKFYQSVLSWLI